MSLKEVEIELFMLECDEMFEEIPLRNRMLIVIRKSIMELKESFYDLGVKKKLPESWGAFKKWMIEYCTEEGIESIVKYRDELWSKYLLRLNAWKVNREHSDEKVMSYLRKQYLPKDLRIIFLSLEMTLDMAISRVREWESFKKDNNANDFLVKENRKNKKFIEKKGFQEIKQKVKCFKCDKMGHYSNECPEKSKINYVSCNRNSIIDRREIMIGDKKFRAIFDTGAACNVIHRSVLNQLGNVICHKDEKVFKNFDNSEWTSNYYVKLGYEYKGIKYVDQFWVVETTGDEIILSNATVKKLEKKKIPIECNIDTKDKGPISWTRPIRSYKDKIDFDTLVQKLEKMVLLNQVYRLG